MDNEKDDYGMSRLHVLHCHRCHEHQFCLFARCMDDTSLLLHYRAEQ